MNTPSPTSSCNPVSVQVYGIPNCDTVKKARSWLTEHGIAFEFHDFKKQGVPPAALDHWLQTLGWESVLNRKGTTWRKLDADTQAAVQDAASAKAVAEFKSGKDSAINALKGPVMKAAKGKANPKLVDETLRRLLAAM